MNCKNLEPIIGCLQKVDGTFEPLSIHYTYGNNAAGVEIIKAVRYTSADGTIRELDPGEVVTSGPCCCPSIKEHYLCIDGVKTPVWVSIQPDTFGINSVVNSLDLSTVDSTEYATGFIDPCDSCELQIMTTTVFNDFGTAPSVGGPTSLSTINGVQVLFTGFGQNINITGIDNGSGVEDNVDSTNSNLPNWINNNLGSLGFAAISTTYSDPLVFGGSPIGRYMELTYPISESWTLDVLNLPEGQGGNLYDGLRYSWDGSTLTVEGLTSGVPNGFFGNAGVGVADSNSTGRPFIV